MPSSVVIVDCDGTLVDSPGHIASVFNRTIVEFGYAPLAPEVVYQVIGLSLDEALHRLLPACDDDHRERIIHAYRAHYAEDGSGKNPLYDGAREFLDGVRAEGRWLAMATGKSRSGALRVVAEHGLSSYFAAIKTGDLCRPKPHPDMLLQILDELGLAPERAVMVGDTTFDIDMAHAAGIQAVGVTCGAHGCDDLEQAGAALIVPRLADLAPHLSRLLP